MTTVNAPTPRTYKDAAYAQVSRIGHAVSAPKRLELLDLLCQGPRTVEMLAQAAQLSVANASQHLQVLRGARLVTSERRGTFLQYRVADPQVADFVVALTGIAERRLPELEADFREFLASRDALEGVNRAELMRRVHAGLATLIDVRPTVEYEFAHMAGAVSVPLAELATWINQVPIDRDIVAYCRGPYCVLAVEAVRLLRDAGRRAFRLDLGVAAWRLAGGALETGAVT